jgi:hypothetical protein
MKTIIRNSKWPSGIPDFGIPVSESTELAVPSRDIAQKGVGE